MRLFPDPSFVTADEVRPFFENKSVAIVGSAPSVLQNRHDYIDSHQVVVRCNNYKLVKTTGRRTDVHYSFYGISIKATPQALLRDGVQLCMCKCPNSRPIHSDWHVRMGKTMGIDFRYIYARRRLWWFTKTYIPTDERFLYGFELLGNHVPTTGFSAILEILSFKPSLVYITGFDWFESKIHNVNERWIPGNPADPIRHNPAAEKKWLKENWKRYPLRGDRTVMEALR